MIYGDFTEFMVISRDLWWFHGIYGDFTGFMVIWWDINDLYSANNHQKKKNTGLGTCFVDPPQTALGALGVRFQS